VLAKWILDILIKQFQFGFEPFLSEIICSLNIKSLHHLQLIDKTSLSASVEHVKSRIDISWTVEDKNKRN